MSKKLSLWGGVFFFGLVFHFWPVFQSGFSVLPGDYGDPRLIHYILEYTWKWLSGDFPGRNFWDFPMFHPVTNTAAYSDYFLGLSPFYVFFRALGLDRVSSLYAWSFFLLVTNYFVMAWFLEKKFLLKPVACAFGAYLFTFASSRLAQVSHFQLWSGVYVVISTWFIWNACDSTHKHRALNALLAGIALSVQFYTAFYYFWYFIFALFVLFPAFVWVYRKDFVKQIPIGVCFAIGLAICIPGALKYLAVTKELGSRTYLETFFIAPIIPSWFYLGEESLLYAFQEKIKLFRMIPTPHEQKIGLGLVTTVLIVLGFVRWPSTKERKVFLWGSIALIAATLVLPKGYSLWRWVYEFFPGANAVRAVARVGIFLLFPFSVAFAFFWNSTKLRREVFAALFLVVALEQFRTQTVWNVRELDNEVLAVSAQIGKDCTALVYSSGVTSEPWWKVQLDGMWVGLSRNIPTVNGYSGKAPMGWRFEDTPFQESLKTWVEKNSLRDICQFQKS